MNSYERKRFFILVMIVSISGFSQGMLLPLIAIIFEQDGVSSTLNGLNATGLYIGTLLISPFIERPLRQYGYKPIIVAGGALVIASLLLFPLWKSVMFWFVLRLFIGIGDHALHFATQTWITSSTPSHKLGKAMAIYGMSFGVGFAVGPLFAGLVELSQTLPFIISSALCGVAWLLIFFVKNEKPEAMMTSEQSGGLERYKWAFKYGWLGFLPPFVYGFIESSLNALFPVYALRIGFEVKNVTMILSAFAVGAIVTQLPLGALGDKIGRKAVIRIGIFGGAAGFLAASFFENSPLVVAACVAFAGMCSGSLFSLGITYMADLTPKAYLPTGNLICGMAFSVGSLAGPFLGGAYLNVTTSSFLYLFAALLFSVFVVFTLGSRRKVPQYETQQSV